MLRRFACHIQGAAGPGGSSALQWFDYLLWFGSCSAYLWDSGTMMACQLSNNVAEWDDISALMDNCLIALDECPGI